MDWGPSGLLFPSFDERQGLELGGEELGVHFTGADGASLWPEPRGMGLAGKRRSQRMWGAGEGRSGEDEARCERRLCKKDDRHHLLLPLPPPPSAPPPQAILLAYLGGTLPLPGPLLRVPPARPPLTSP